MMHGLLGRPGRAAPLARQALEQFRELGHGLGEHYALGSLANALRAQGDYAGALEAHRTVLRYYRHDSGLTTAGVAVCSAAVLRYIAQDLAAMGRWPAAAESYAEAARLFAGSGVLGEAHAAYGEGIALREMGRPAQARDRLRRAVDIYAHLDSPWGEAQAMHALASLTPAPDEARALLHLAVERCAEVDDAQSRDLAAEICHTLRAAAR
jgi:tetratricopeptide (TPR) repeat protein